MNKLWKKFERLTDECYGDMLSANADKSIWHQTFDTLVKIIEEERSKNPDFAKEYYQVDETTDFKYGVDEWITDYLDELAIHKQYEKQYEVCQKIIDLFAWEEQSSADFRFDMAFALREQGKIEEAVEFCEAWYKEEPEAELSAVSLIYAKTSAKDYTQAEQIVEKYISKGDECTEENEVLYRAAVNLYEEKGDKKTAKQMKKSLKKYEDEVDRELMEEFEELPFGDGFDEIDDFDDGFDDFEGFDDEDDGRLPFID